MTVAASPVVLVLLFFLSSFFTFCLETEYFFIYTHSFSHTSHSQAQLSAVVRVEERVVHHIISLKLCFPRSRTVTYFSLLKVLTHETEEARWSFFATSLRYAHSQVLWWWFMCMKKNSSTVISVIIFYVLCTCYNLWTHGLSLFFLRVVISAILCFCSVRRKQACQVYILQLIWQIFFT